MTSPTTTTVLCSRLSLFAITLVLEPAVHPPLPLGNQAVVLLELLRSENTGEVVPCSTHDQASRAICGTLPFSVELQNNLDHRGFPMQGSRMRRLLPWLVLSLLLLSLAVAGCQMPSSQPAGGTASTEAEADKTRRMEEKAAEIARKEEEIRNMQGTEQEKMDAMNELDRMRRELADMQ